MTPPGPLPELTPATEWFWTSGADGVLRIQGCRDCGTLVHPPVPICPTCRSRASAPVAVSGRATVVGVTVNAHPWLPTLPPPYVIANVALEEDPSVRLTTNVVGCEPDAVHIGQEVAVRFEPHDDVWLPLFEPTGGPDALDRVPEPSLPAAPARGEPGPLRGAGGPVRRRSLRHRPAADGRPAVAHRRRLPGGGGRCRAAARGHRRPVDLPRRRGHGHERGRRVRRGGCAAAAPDVDQRRGRPPRSRVAR